MTHDGARATITTTHVGDWTILRVRDELDAESWAALTSMVTANLTMGARIALDLHGAGGPTGLALDTSRQAITHLVTRADDARAHLVVVESDDTVREAWRAAGFSRVHESLDEALRDVAPVVRDRPVDEPLLPAAGDTQLVATEDLTGRRTTL